MKPWIRALAIAGVLVVLTPARAQGPAPLRLAIAGLVHGQCVRNGIVTEMLEAARLSAGTHKPVPLTRH